MSASSSSKPDYAKWSLYLGGGSLLIGVAYFFWQYKNAESEAKYKWKYKETRKAIQAFQVENGLHPSGKIDISTQALLKTLAFHASPAPKST